MSRIEKLFELAKSFYSNGDPSHDINHIQRVMANCRQICLTERANLDIVLAAALLHDLVNLPKNHPERLQASQMAAEKSHRYLVEAGFSSEEIEKIKSVIKEHSYSLGQRPSSVESAILQDADKLDALGAIGVMRTVTTGCRMNSSYYNVTDLFAQDRDWDDKNFTVDHFFTKLLKLPDLMNTAFAKTEAERRAQFMIQFLNQLESELPRSHSHF